MPMATRREPKAMSFQRDEQLVRNPHASRKDIRPSKLQSDGRQGQCDTASWLRELCLSSCGPLAHLVAKPPSPH